LAAGSARPQRRPEHEGWFCVELSIDVHRDGNDAVVTVAGELDISNAPELQDALAELTDAPRRVAVDLSGLEFIDSSGLAALLGAHKDLQEHGGTLELRHPSKMVVGLVQITGLDDVFEIRLS
jgi:anti-sigma B factor antagonist